MWFSGGSIGRSSFYNQAPLLYALADWNSLWLVSYSCESRVCYGFKGSLTTNFPYRHQSSLVSLHPGTFSHFSPMGRIPGSTQPSSFLQAYPILQIQFSHSIMSDSLQPHGLQHTRLPCPSPTPGVGDTIHPSHPLPSPSPPTLNLSQHQGLFKWVSSSHQVAEVLEFQLQHQPFQWIFRTEFL